MKKLLTAIFVITCLSSFSQEKEPYVTSKTSINLSVVNLDESEKYYTSVYGFESLKMPNEQFRSVKRWLKIANGAELHLEAGRVKIITSDYKKQIHLFFETTKEKAEKLKSYFAANKLRTDSLEKSEKEPAKTYTLDPDGYVIEIKEIN